MARRAAIIVAAVLLMVEAPLFIFGVHLPRFLTTQGGLDRSLCERSTLPVPPPPGHLTVVVVDGLGFDYAQALPELGWLREVAAMRPLDVEFPSFTTPALLSFVTGVGPGESGVRLNAPTAALTSDLDHLRACADAAGRPIDFFDGGWAPFRAIMFTDDRVLWKGRRAMEAAPFVSRPARSLRVVYFGDVDEAGHEHGEASDEFRAAAVRVSTYLRRHVAKLAADDRILIVSDHGHLPGGGHGGVEPEILRATFAAVGRDVRRGAVLESRSIDDVASTIATLAGVPTPGCNRGAPMLDVLELDDATALALAQNAHAQRDALARRVVPRIDDYRLARLAIVLLITLLLLAVAKRRLPPKEAWGAPLAMLAGYGGFLVARGYRVTFSKMPPQSEFVRDAAIAAIIGFVLAIALSRWKKLAGADVALLLGMALPMSWMAAWVGSDPRVVPPPLSGIAVILWSPMLIAAGLAAIVVSFFRFSVARLPAAAASEPA